MLYSVSWSCSLVRALLKQPYADAGSAEDAYRIRGGCYEESPSVSLMLVLSDTLEDSAGL